MREKQVIRHLISEALKEDIGPGDITTQAVLTGEETGQARAMAKEELVVAGLDIFTETFRLRDENISVITYARDGSMAQPGDELAELKGNLGAILTAERVALNFLQRMSGIATLTRKYVEAVADWPVKILDTRKTVPGLRLLDKYAVRVGGGHNHRFGLHDGILIKDNHIAAAQGITKAINMVRKSAHHLFKLEIEVRSPAEALEALAAGADVIMLDNMSLKEIRQAVNIVDRRVPLEASGNVTLDNVREIAATGVDYISIGTLTHSVTAADISLKVII